MSPFQYYYTHEFPPRSKMSDQTANLKDYEKHVLYIRATNITGVEQAYCGATLDQFDWRFMDADHALSSLDEGSRLVPCPKCAAKIIEILSKA